MDEEIDVNKLRKELGAAVQADDDYWRENEAKFRAVRQKVSSYEEFRYVQCYMVVQLQSALCVILGIL